MEGWWSFPDIKIINQFYDHPGYIDCFVARGKQFDLKAYDHILFSYHGLPERQVDKVYKDRKCRNHSCEHEINDENELCYKATCYATTRSISDKVIEQLGKEGKKKLLVFSPAFVADCLETTIEIGHEYQELFEEHGGEKVQLVPSLNDGDDWVEALVSVLGGK
jgi:ferrochelatase